MSTYQWQDASWLNAMIAAVNERVNIANEHGAALSTITTISVGDAINEAEQLAGWISSIQSRLIDCSAYFINTYYLATANTTVNGFDYARSYTAINSFSAQPRTYTIGGSGVLGGTARDILRVWDDGSTHPTDFLCCINGGTVGGDDRTMTRTVADPDTWSWTVAPVWDGPTLTNEPYGSYSGTVTKYYSGFRRHTYASPEESDLDADDSWDQDAWTKANGTPPHEGLWWYEGNWQPNGNFDPAAGERTEGDPFGEWMHHTWDEQFSEHGNFNRDYPDPSEKNYLEWGVMHNGDIIGDHIFDDIARALALLTWTLEEIEWVECAPS